MSWGADCNSLKIRLRRRALLQLEHVAARGRGGARGTPLADGPWDIGEGENRVHVTVVTKGLDHPWGMAILPNGDMLVTERAGRLRVIRKGVLDPNPVGGLPQIRAATLGGLLDIALHPNFAQNRLVVPRLFQTGNAGSDELDDCRVPGALGWRRYVD